MAVDVGKLQQDQTAGLVKGVVPPNGEVALRLEIDDLLKDTELANLYLIAMEAFQNDIRINPNNSFSYQAIAGIHGLSNKIWDGVTDGRGDSTKGYCTHGRPTFPTWHRVYLAQFEQALYLHAAKLVKDVHPEPKDQQELLKKFRIPYFDPYRPRVRDSPTSQRTYGLPVILTLPYIKVKKTFGGEYKEIENPLYSFSLANPGRDVTASVQDPNSSIRDPRDPRAYTQVSLSKTYRNTLPWTQSGQPPPIKVQMQSDHRGIKAGMNSEYNPRKGVSGDSVSHNLWKLFLDNRVVGDRDLIFKDWLDMSNHYARGKLRPNGKPWDPHDNATYVFNSLEGWHDNVHGNFSGVMGDPGVAGYDPVFWLHHCNVDRLLAIWQGIRSKDSDQTKWWSQSEVGTPQTYGPGAALYPFRKSGSRNNPQWWTSNDTRDHRKMGYDYPETAAALAKGDIAGELTKFANETLSTLGTGSLPIEAKEEKEFDDSSSIEVPFWPISGQDRSKMAMDGLVPYTKDMVYLGSQPRQPRPQPGSRRMMAAAAPPAGQPMALTATHATGKAEEALVPEPPIPHLVKADTATLPAPLVGLEPFHYEIMQAALPAKETSVEHRCGAGHKLVCHNKITEWGVSFTVDKFCLNGSFHVVFFLGDFNPDRTTWRTENNVAGASYVFASGNERVEGGCSNCHQQKEEGIKYGDTLSLTDPILSYYTSQGQPHGHQITSLDPSVVVPFLKRELHWRIIKANGDEVSRSEVPSLKVGVYSETVHLPVDPKQPPRFENTTLHYEITEGRPNGLSQGENFYVG